MKSAGAGYTSGEDLSSLGDELSELSYVLVIDSVNLVLAEDANLLSSVHRTEARALSIVSFHFDSPLTFPTHVFDVSSVIVSLVTKGERLLRRAGSRRWEFLQSLHRMRY